MNIYMLVVQTAWDCMVISSSAIMAAVFAAQLATISWLCSSVMSVLNRTIYNLKGSFFAAVRPP